MNKISAVFVLSVIAMGAFSSIPNVAAQVPVGLEDKMMKASGTFQPKFGSLYNKVCGLELCNSKSVPNLDLTPEIKETIKETSSKNLALEKALQSGEASDILASYLSFKGGITIQEVEKESTVVESYDFNNFANPDFFNPSYQSTVMKSSEEVLDRSVDLPDYLDRSYANKDFPVYEKPEPVLSSIVIEEIEMIEEPETLIVNNMTSDAADLILAKMGFDIDLNNVGVCGPGTTNIGGICMADTLLDTESANIDWTDYWKVKEEEVETLENVIMTDGEETIPVVDNEVSMEVPAPDNLDVEEMVVEPVKEEIVIETLTTVPVEPVKEPVQEQENPRVSTSQEDSGFDDSGLQ